MKISRVIDVTEDDALGIIACIVWVVVWTGINIFAAATIEAVFDVTYPVIPVFLLSLVVLIIVTYVPLNRYASRKEREGR